MRHAVIMAGGSGTRLWPLSRRSRPKQLLKLFGGQSLLRKSFERLSGFMDPRHIHVITGKDFLPAVAAELPELPERNLIGEPCPRDTANAVGLAANLLALRDPGGTMGVFTADHIITPVDAFQRALADAYDAAETHADALLTFGVKPTGPHTGYGYIHRGETIGPGLFAVRRFKEKPDEATARRYFESGEFYWNSGMFVWRIETILEQFRRHQPVLAEGLRQTAAEMQDPARSAAAGERFAALPRIAIDFAIMEKADRVLVRELPCAWLDVGSWTSLPEVLAPDSTGNTVAAPRVESLDATGNILVSESDHLIAAVGVSGLIVVHSDDATLVCRREDAQRIKTLLENLQRTQGDRYA
ncbi:MAG: mannose-1-phosphate guanylyltransferase [Phycisphaerae bacterium]